MSDLRHQDDEAAVGADADVPFPDADTDPEPGDPSTSVDDDYVPA